MRGFLLICCWHTLHINNKLKIKPFNVWLTNISFTAFKITNFDDFFIDIIIINHRLKTADIYLQVGRHVKNTKKQNQYHLQEIQYTKAWQRGADTS